MSFGPQAIQAAIEAAETKLRRLLWFQAVLDGRGAIPMEVARQIMTEAVEAALEAASRHKRRRAKP